MANEVTPPKAPDVEPGTEPVNEPDLDQATGRPVDANGRIIHKTTYLVDGVLVDGNGNPVKE